MNFIYKKNDIFTISENDGDGRKPQEKNKVAKLLAGTAWKKLH